MKLHNVALVAAIVAILGCGGTATSDESATTAVTAMETTTTAVPTTTTTVPTTTTTTLSDEEKAQIQIEADSRLIRQVWRDFSDVSGRSATASYEFLADATHPLYRCTAHDYQVLYDWPEDYAFEVIVDFESFEPDPEWTPSRFPSQVPEGRLYIYQITVTTSSASQGWPPEQQLLEVHGAVIGDKAHIFFECT